MVRHSSLLGLRTINRRPRLLHMVTWLAVDVNKPTHLSKGVGHVVPGVVVYLSIHGSGEIKNGLISAAWGTLYKLTSDLTR